VLQLHQPTHLLRPSPIPALDHVLVFVPPPVPVPVSVLFLDTAIGSDFDFGFVGDLFWCAIRGKKWKERTGTCQSPEYVLIKRKREQSITATDHLLLSII
jgi:hypothetical protein